MAVEIQHSSTSPRISFCRDLPESSDTTTNSNETYPSSAFEFAFSVDESDIEPGISCSTADELFSDGKILPTDIKRDRDANTTIEPRQETSSLPPTNTTTRSTKTTPLGIQNVEVPADMKNRKPNSTKTNIVKSLRDFLADEEDEEAENGTNPTSGSLQKSPSSSFWNFKRSNSLNNCDSRNNQEESCNRRLITPLNILSRSKSAGEYISKQMSIIEEEKEEPPRSFWKFNRSKSVNIPDFNNSRGIIQSIKVLLRSNSTSIIDPADQNPTTSMPIPKISNKQSMRRSSSLNNYDNHKYHHFHVSIGSITFLSRSNSTGSAPNPRKEYYLKQHFIRRQKSIRTNGYKSRFSKSGNQMYNSSRRKAVFGGELLSTSTTTTTTTTSRDQKGGNQQVKITCKDSSSVCNGSGHVKIMSPVLDVPYPYNSSRSAKADLFGFSSLLCGRDKR